MNKLTKCKHCGAYPKIYKGSDFDDGFVLSENDDRTINHTCNVKGNETNTLLSGTYSCLIKKWNELNK